MENTPDKGAQINAVISEVEAVEFDETMPGWAALYARLSGGSVMRLEFNVQAFISLEAAISAAQAQMSAEQGKQ
jgi:hypothetical protein